MPLAPTTMPSPPQSVTSVVSTMLTVTTCPQLTAVGTGAAPTVHDQVAGVASALPACVDRPDVERVRSDRDREGRR